MKDFSKQYEALSKSATDTRKNFIFDDLSQFLYISALKVSKHITCSKYPNHAIFYLTSYPKLKESAKRLEDAIAKVKHCTQQDVKDNSECSKLYMDFIITSMAYSSLVFEKNAAVDTFGFDKQAYDKCMALEFDESTNQLVFW